MGWKALAVNLSDLAAMGAQPAWCTLSLTLPHADAAFVDGFLRWLPRPRGAARRGAGRRRYHPRPAVRVHRCARVRTGGRGPAPRRRARWR
ncbi:hypothetical protein LJB71_00390 [Thermomonas sp. S9]|nr:hypothetical protein [Thermomonas sp. S9]